VPVVHGKRLFELAREPKQLWIVPGGGHIQAFCHESYRDRFVAWLKQVLSAPPAGSGWVWRGRGGVNAT